MKTEHEVIRTGDGVGRQEEREVGASNAARGGGRTEDMIMFKVKLQRIQKK